MKLMWALLGVASVAAVAYLWRLSRQPFHHRGIRPGQFQDVMPTLLRGGDGSRLIIEDETGKNQVIAQKFASKREIIELKLFTACEGNRSVLRVAILEAGISSAEVTEAGEEFASYFLTSGDEARYSEIRELLEIIFRWLGTGVSSTYHLYFELSRPDDGVLRHNLAKIASNPAESERRRDAAEKAIDRIRRK